MKDTMQENLNDLTMYELKKIPAIYPIVKLVEMLETLLLNELCDDDLVDKPG